MFTYCLVYNESKTGEQYKEERTEAGEDPMPRERENIQTNNGDPHFDGRYEGIIAHPEGTSQMGIRVDRKQSESAYEVTSLKKDLEMERFKQFFDGKE
ncbi:hypothetical protein MKZ02_08215 [Pseudobacillus sp. FSL P4-0506]|uniref:hypothetical protein n=1 Tax=Pseudobacillus sp. FSL P4-0506 TaxID=2921576 RepID=UPI0030F9AE26